MLHLALHSFPTRRSSDLVLEKGKLRTKPQPPAVRQFERDGNGHAAFDGVVADRKSTRLNSSHTVISYAVFCLKKKKKTTIKMIRKATLTERIQMTYRDTS